MSSLLSHDHHTGSQIHLQLLCWSSIGKFHNLAVWQHIYLHVSWVSVLHLRTINFNCFFNVHNLEDSDDCPVVSINQRICSECSLLLVHIEPASIKNRLPAHWSGCRVLTHFQHVPWVHQWKHWQEWSAPVGLVQLSLTANVLSWNYFYSLLLMRSSVGNECVGAHNWPLPWLTW